MGITDAKLFLCHGILEQKRYKIISVREYNYRKIYDYFNNSFIVDCVSTYFNLPLMPPVEISISNKRARYIPDQLPVTISVASGKTFSSLTNHSEPPHNIILGYDDLITDHTIIRDKPGCAKEKRG